MLFKRKAKRLWPKRVQIDAPALITQKGFGTEIPPHQHWVNIYFDQKGVAAQAEHFYNFYEQARWSSPKGTPYRNWKLLAADWIFDYEQAIKLKKRQRSNCGSVVWQGDT